MKYIIRLARLAIIGLGVGELCTLGCMWALVDGAQAVTMDQVLSVFSVWAVASALLGMCGMLFQTNTLNKFAALALHMVLCMFIVLMTCFLLGYISSPAEFMVHIFPLFLVIYIILAVVFFLHDRKQVRQINQKLKERQ